MEGDYSQQSGWGEGGVVIKVDRSSHMVVRAELAGSRPGVHREARLEPTVRKSCLPRESETPTLQDRQFQSVSVSNGAECPGSNEPGYTGPKEPFPLCQTTERTPSQGKLTSPNFIIRSQTPKRNSMPSCQQDIQYSDTSDRIKLCGEQGECLRGHRL